MSSKPKFKNDPMYMLLREGTIDEFDKRKAQGEPMGFCLSAPNYTA